MSDAGAHGHLAHPVEVALQSFEHTVDRLVHQEAAVHLQKPAGSRIYETRLSRVAIPLAHRETCVVAVTVMRGAGEGRVDLGTPKVLIRSQRNFNAAGLVLELAAVRNVLPLAPAAVRVVRTRRLDAVGGRLDHVHDL